jgi:hypothetical protein
LLLAVAGDVDDALAAEAEAEAIIADLGSEFYFGGFGLVAGDLERLLGRFERSEQLLRRADAVSHGSVSGACARPRWRSSRM